jgi:catechol 2,3-dioxygenase
MGFHSKPNIYVGHVRIKVENLQRSLTFYQDILGFRIQEKTKTTAKLAVSGQTSILSVEQPINVVPKQRRTTGLYHFAILLPHRTDLANIAYHLLKHNIQMASADHLVSEAIYISDPDGNGIEIYADRDSSEWNWYNGEVAMTVDPLDFENLLSHAQPEQKWKGLPTGTVMGHIHLHVADLKKAEAFYVNVLGYKVVNRYGTQALFLSTGKYHHHIGLNTWNGVGAPAPKENSVGLASFTLLLPNENTRLQIVKRLKESGTTFKKENGVYITSDPSENKIRLDI